MDANTSYFKLIQTLEEMVSCYRQLLEVVKQEKIFLIEVQILNLDQSNSDKEILLGKIKVLDQAREKQARILALELKVDPREARLLELAKKSKEAGHATQLRQLHTTLVFLIERVSEMNRENEIYVQSALSTVRISMGDIKETLGGQKTYARKGQMQEGPNRSGNLVSKEA